MFKAGVTASAGLILFYYLVLWLLTKDPVYPWQQFLKLQPWMSLLILGFGLEWALFSRLRQGRIMVGGTTVVSGATMVACCAHHAVDVLPFLGIAGASVFLVNYQKELLIFGLLVNLAGIIYLLRRLSK